MKDVYIFLEHLRLHYQICILSGAFLLGGLFSGQENIYEFILQFLNVHVLLFGGVTAYNSYWDKDEGPIGGLKNPKKMKYWMLLASWILQIIGLILAGLSGWLFFSIYLVSVLFFWLYSSPNTRWKGRPLLSLIAIGISTALSPFILGYIALGGGWNFPYLASLGSVCMVLSLFPISQIYQIQEDIKRGDTTFASRYGISGVKNICIYLFLTGLILITYDLYEISSLYAIAFFLIGVVAWGLNIRQLGLLLGKREEYSIVMNMKYTSGMLFSLLIIVTLFLEILI